ncbi:MAG TPA: ABC transporter substrate-binding protein [Caulobacteraceae bacterium]|jgi:sulfonate transport system substrate-binding protein|nr:ABC transporter substrate-binding protein [Caulobacteraceae bacterium]
MIPTRTGVAVIVLSALLAAASVMAWAARAHRGVFAEAGAAEGLEAGRLALDAPIPDKVPPGVKLVIGDPMTEQVLRRTGWDRQLPFQIQWAEITGGPAVTEAFHAKALDVGAAADIPPIHAVFVGIPVKMIAVRFRQDPQHHPLYVLAVAPGAGVRTLADLRGKRIAFSPGQVQGETVLRSLEAAHLATDDVKLVELPSTSGDVYISALVGGLVDVAPIGAGVVAKHYVDSYGDEGARLIAHSATRDDLTDLYVRTETLEDPGKAAALRAYVKLWARAQAWVATHHDEFARLYYVGREGLSLADARYTEQASGEPDIPRDWSEAIALEQASVDLMAKESGHRPFDAATLFDRRFEAAAADALAEGRPVAGSQTVALAQRQRTP